MVGSLYPGIPTCTRSNTSGCAIPLHPACDNLKRIGDPAFLLPVPAVQYRSDYLVLVPEGYAENFAGVASPAGTTVVIDGVPSTVTATAIGGTGWEVRNIPLAPGTHRVSADVGIGVSIHGYGCDVSYAYPGGLNLESAP
jgi:hypothetical protein